MTIRNRNKLILLGAILGGIVALGVIALIVVFSFNPQILLKHTENTPFLKVSPWIPVLSASFLCIVGAVCIFCVLFLFEKTQSHEISFFCIFVFSLFLEIARLIFPIANFFSLSDDFLRIATRLVVFARLVGSFSLFSAALFSSNRLSKQFSRFAISIFVVSFFFAVSMPLNALNKMEGMLLFPGYFTILCVVISVSAFLTPVSFCLSSYALGASDYKKTAISTLVLLVGINSVFYATMPITFVVGLVAVILGCLFYIKSIHNYYLWG